MSGKTMKRILVIAISLTVLLGTFTLAYSQKRQGNLLSKRAYVEKQKGKFEQRNGQSQSQEKNTHNPPCNCGGTTVICLAGYSDGCGECCARYEEWLNTQK